MRKNIIILFCTIFLMIQSISVSANENTHILVHIKEASECYLVTFENEQMHVKIISNNVYLPIPALHNEPSRLKDVHFIANYNSLVFTIESFLNIKIDYYAALDIKTLMEDLNIDSASYDYKSLSSLTKIASNIKEKITLQTLLKYDHYIDTNLNLETLYEIYKICKNNKLKIDYYTLSYFISEQGYLPLERTFYIRKK